MPNPETVRKALAVIRKGHAEYEYFFDSLSSPEWIEPLLAEELFREPPDPIRKGEYIRFPFWPESRYLARVAAKAPECVAKVILQVRDTENIHVHEDFVDAALSMPPALSAKVVRRARAWFESPYHSLLPEKLGRLMVHLAEDEPKAALALAREVLSVLPDSQKGRGDTEEGGYHFPPEPETRIDISEYEEILRACIPVLVRHCEDRVLTLLCDLLEQAVGCSIQGGEDKEGEDYSCVWRPAIEDHKQNHDHGAKELLALSVRNASETLIARKGKVVLDAIESRRFKVFKRIGMYLRARFPKADAEGTAALLGDRNTVEDPALHHERFRLLSEQFGDLPEEVQNEYLGIVEQGIDPESWLSFMEQEEGRRPSAEEAVRYVEHWQYVNLWPVQRFIHEHRREKFDRLRVQFGDIPHPDFLVYSESWSGPTSPKNATDLESMTVTEVVSYLKTWNVLGKPMTPSPEGLGRELMAAVIADPSRFAREAVRFREVDPTYVRALLMGLGQACQSKSAISWEPILELCLWVMRQPREIPGRKWSYCDRDPDWSWTRRAIASLLGIGLQQGPHEIAPELRDTVWQVLERLTDDPDPTPEDEARLGGSNMAPDTLSINTVRGEAMHTVMRYALWIGRHLGPAPGNAECILSGFGSTPEVGTVLDLHLNPDVDPSPAIRSVYGQWFNTLFLLDRTWAFQNVARVFPEAARMISLRDAAWNAYLAWSQPHDDAFRVLRGEYQKAVDELAAISKQGGMKADVGKRLAEHLMILYARGRLHYDEQGGILQRFYANASAGVLAHAVTWLGRDLQKPGTGLPDDVMERLCALWTNRLIAASTTPSEAYCAEIAHFGWWFVSGKFQEDWAIGKLKEVISTARKVDPSRLVVERLAQIAPSRPLDAVECLRLIVEAEHQGLGIDVWQEHARSLLAAVLSSRDEHARRVAEEVVDRLLQRGFRVFRGLPRGE